MERVGMSSERELRHEMVEAGKRLYFKDLVAACDGNISARLSDNEFLVTPSGVSKGFFTADQILKIDSSGKVMEGYGKPTRETEMHLGIYRERPDVKGVVHAHPPLATGFGCTDEAFDRVLLPEVVFELGSIAVAEYAVPTTKEVAESIVRVLDEHTNAVVLSNHGAVTMGPSVLQAYYNMETLEAVARITMTAQQVGTPRYLSSRQVDDLHTMLGRSTPGVRQASGQHATDEREVIDTVVAEVVRRLQGGALS